MDYFEHDSSTGKAILEVLNETSPWRRPIWLMRQAGRYLPEYRELRASAGSFLDLCYAPELAAEVTLQPLRRFDLDAAIIFADILLLPQALGCELAFKENEGPKLSPVRNLSDFNRLKDQGAVARLEPVYETVSRVKEALPAHVGLIGFCGAPWTVATYVVEGGTSADRKNTKLAAFAGADWFEALIGMLVETSIDYLSAQIEAGAEVVQVFDTWAGDLSDDLRDRYCFAPIAKIAAGVRSRHPGVPVIGFARGIGVGHLEFARQCGLDAVGVEWSVPLDWINSTLQEETVMQGNLDPLCLVAGGEGLAQGVQRICNTVRYDRHIMNLGHGIRQDTPPEHVAELVKHVRNADRERGG